MFPVEGDLRSLRAIKDNELRLHLAAEDIDRLAAGPTAAFLTTLQANIFLDQKTMDALKRLPKLTSLRCNAHLADNAVLAQLKELPGVTNLVLCNAGSGGQVIANRDSRAWLAFL